MLTSGTGFRFAFTGTRKRVPHLGCAASGCIIDELTSAARQVTVIAWGAVSQWITLASTCGVVKGERIVAETDAAAVVNRKVPNLIEVARMRQRLANAIAMVDVHISIRALLTRARERIERVRRAGLHELRFNLCHSGRGWLDCSRLKGSTRESDSRHKFHFSQLINYFLNVAAPFRPFG